MCRPHQAATCTPQRHSADEDTGQDVAKSPSGRGTLRAPPSFGWEQWRTLPQCHLSHLPENPGPWPLGRLIRSAPGPLQGALCQPKALTEPRPLCCSHVLSSSFGATSASRTHHPHEACDQPHPVATPQPPDTPEGQMPCLQGRLRSIHACQSLPVRSEAWGESGFILPPGSHTCEVNDGERTEAGSRHLIRGSSRLTCAGHVTRRRRLPPQPHASLERKVHKVC